MTLEWQRSRKPSGLRSQGYVGLTAPKHGMKPSTRPGLRLSSTLKKVENVYYPPAIHRSAPSFPRIDAKSEVVEVSKDSTTNVTTTSIILSKEAARLRATEKEKNSNPVVAPDAMKPPSTSQNPPTKKEASKTIEIVLTSLPLPTKPDLVSKGLEVSEVATAQPIRGLPKEKILIKKEIN